MRATIIVTALCFSTMSLAVADEAAAAIRKPTHVAAQSLGSALKELADERGLQVLFFSDTVRNLKSGGASGNISAEEAFQQLLSGTGLIYRFIDDKTVAIESPKKTVDVIQIDTSLREDPRPTVWNRLRLAQAPVAGASQDTASNAADSAGDLDEIVVTAQKFEERLREVPMSISAATGDQLQRQGATKLSDYAGYIPALNFSPGSAPGSGEINLRGVTTALSPSASTAVYVDEVPTTTHGTWGSNGYKPADLFPYDLERVEILRGPQGTLYGDSTIGGLIKYVTRPANVDAFSSSAGVEGVSISGGDGLGGGARAMINAPIKSGVFGVRLSGFYQQTPGYVTNVVTGEEGVNEVRQRGVRLAARLTPSEAFSVDAQWLHTELDGDGLSESQLIPDTTHTLDGDYKDSFLLDQPTTHDFDLVAATARYDFGPATLTSVSSYSKVTRATTFDVTSTFGGLIAAVTGGAVTDGLAGSEGPTTNEKFTQELRLASAQDRRMTWLVGAYYSAEDTKTRQRIVPFDADGAPLTDLIEFYDDQVKAHYKDLSAFANGTFKFTDKWEISAGVRHSLIDDKFHERATGLLLSGSTTVPYFDDIKTDNTSTTWSLGTRYLASDDLMMFARVASGFRAGGINYTWPGADKSYDPDSLVSYEAGIRADFLSHKISTDLTVYYLDWKDLFILAFTPDVFQFGYQVNGGRASGIGTEFTGTLRPTRALTLTVTAARFGLKLREDLPTIGGQSGDRTPDSPALSGSISASYSVPFAGDWEMNLGGGVRMASHTYSRFIHDPAAIRIPSYALLDLNAGVSHDRWTLRSYVKNLTNENSFISIGSQQRGVQHMPRTVGLALDVKF